MELSIPQLDDLTRQIADMRAEVKRLTDRLEDREPEVWNTDRVARHYGVTPKTIRNHVKAGRLEVRRIGVKMAFDPDTLPETLG